MASSSRVRVPRYLSFNLPVAPEPKTERLVQPFCLLLCTRVPSTTSLDRCSALESRLIRRKWSRILRLFESESDKIGAQRPAFAFQEPLYAGFSAGSPVLNEVVLEGFSPKCAPLPWHRFSAVSMPSG